MRYFVVILGVFLLSHSAQGQECEQAFTPEEPFDRSKTEDMVRDINYQFNYENNNATNFVKELKDFVQNRLPEESDRQYIMDIVGRDFIKHTIADLRVDKKIATLRTLIELGVETELSDFIFAIKRAPDSSLKIMQTILENSPKTYTPEDLQPVLSAAIKSKQAKSITFLLDQGVKPDSWDIYYLFKNKQEYLLDPYVGKNVIIDTLSDASKNSHSTALQKAIYNINMPNSVIKSLLKYGADPNALSGGESGASPIHFFSYDYKNSERVMSRQDLEQRILLLVEAGADLGVKNKISNNSIAGEILHLHLSHKTGEGDYMNLFNAFLSVAESKNQSLQISLIPQKNLVFGKYKYSSVNSGSSTAIFLTNLLSNKQEDLFKKVVSHLENINETDKHGNTLLHHIFNRFMLSDEMISFLVKQGANVNTINNEAESPFDLILRRSDMVWEEYSLFQKKFGFELGSDIKLENLLDSAKSGGKSFFDKIFNFFKS